MTQLPAGTPYLAGTIIAQRTMWNPNHLDGRQETVIRVYTPIGNEQHISFAGFVGKIGDTVTVALLINETTP
jgi:hypothetical protein